MTEAPRSDDLPPGIADEAESADGVVAVADREAAGKRDSQSQFGVLKQSLTNHWTVQDR